MTVLDERLTTLPPTEEPAEHGIPPFRLHPGRPVAPVIPRPAGTPPAPEKPQRLVALDALRGLTIILMLLVNNIALDSATPKMLQHAAWGKGITLADMVFPWFLFCVGVALPFAAASFRKKGLPSWHYDLKVLMRTVVLVLLGILVETANNPRHHPVFSLGILQIIGLAYLVGALLVDLPATRRLLIAGGLLAAYWAAIKFLPIPGVGAGMLGETQNFIYHLNVTYLSGVYLWGLPSLVPTSALVLIATTIGDLLRAKALPWERGVALLAAGGGLLVAARYWSHSLFISKALETPAYILFTAGTATLLLGIIYLLVDAPPWPRWPRWPRWWAFPLQVFGANAILAYLAPILTRNWILQIWRLGPTGHDLPLDQWLLNFCTAHYGRITGGWVFTWGIILAWWVVLWLLYRKRVFLRV